MMLIESRLTKEYKRLSKKANAKIEGLQSIRDILIVSPLIMVSPVFAPQSEGVHFPKTKGYIGNLQKNRKLFRP